MPKPPGQSVIQVRVTLDEVVPAVWRRLLVPGSVKLARLHEILQSAMGWTNSHLHRFVIGDTLYGMHFDDYPEDEIDETEVTVLSATREHQHFSYEYDFGDCWDHELVVEQRTVTPRGLKHAVCLDGQNACPPEDCGGAGGFAELLEVLRDPSHEDHDELTKWVGGSFDPEFFDLIAVNVALQQLR